MFTKPLEYIITKENLLNAYQQISKRSKGLDEVSFQEFDKQLYKNIEKLKNSIYDNSYIPEPLKKIEIDKSHSDEKRAIGISSIKDKIVQKVLYDNINSYFDKTFSDKSYAYRADKSTMKAINRVTQFLNEKNFHIIKTDIRNFFEEINHSILLKIVEKEIADKKIVTLIALFLHTGGFQKFDYKEHKEGVHQGDILSPLLSNIYLNIMDRYLEDKNIAFVRYADDFVLLFQSKSQPLKELPKLKKVLQKIDLQLNQEKTVITHISDGFTFLGVHFEGKNRYIENERVQKKISILHTLAKQNDGFLEYITQLNYVLTTLKNYYLKIIVKNSTQHQLLKDATIESIAQKVFLAKESKKVTTKKEFKIFLEQIKLHFLFDVEEIKDTTNLIITKGYEHYLANKSYSKSLNKVNKKRDQYAKKFADESTLHINHFGIMLGISKNKFVLKEYGKVKQSYPFSKIKRVIFEGKGFSISSDLLKKCADNNITVDFIDTKASHYASLITYKASLSQHIYKQALILNTPKQLELAQGFITGKAKNQINYLKYLNKYHSFLDEKIVNMELHFKKIKSAKDREVLMGIEGTISVSYWSALRLVLAQPFEKRITKGAKDIVNSSLNYGYAILYGRVQHYLVYAGLSLNISFLHTIDNNKPTLSFDMIEEFRTFVVDRVVISMLNKDEPIKLDKDGLLTKPSRQLIAKNIKEKLSSYTMWRKESRKVENILQIQCYNLLKAIDNEKKYKPFIGKF